MLGTGILRETHRLRTTLGTRVPQSSHATVQLFRGGGKMLHDLIKTHPDGIGVVLWMSLRNRGDVSGVKTLRAAAFTFRYSESF
jgi:hypothetical protein